MSDKTKSILLEDYREAVRLHMWFNESPHSFSQAQKSKEQANRWLKVAHKTLIEYNELIKKET